MDGGGAKRASGLVVKRTHCVTQKAYLLKRSKRDPTEFRYRLLVLDAAVWSFGTHTALRRFIPNK